MKRSGHPLVVTEAARTLARSEDAPSTAVLAALCLELAAITVRVDRLEERRQRRNDPVRDGQLLAAIAHWIGSAAFSTTDVLTSSDPELQAVMGATNARALGAWLKRLRAQPVAPYVLRRIKREGGGTLWTLHVSGA